YCDGLAQPALPTVSGWARSLEGHRVLRGRHLCRVVCGDSRPRSEALEMIARSRSYLWSILFAAALVSVYLGERVVSAGRARWAFTIVGIVLVLSAVIARALRVATTAGERRRIETYLLLLKLLGVASLIIYFVQSDVWTNFGVKPLHDGWPRLAVVLAVAWPA